MKNIYVEEEERTDKETLFGPNIMQLHVSQISFSKTELSPSKFIMLFSL